MKLNISLFQIWHKHPVSSTSQCALALLSAAAQLLWRGGGSILLQISVWKASKVVATARALDVMVFGEEICPERRRRDEEEMIGAYRFG